MNAEPSDVRLIPNLLLSRKSSAEARVFEVLESLELGEDWVAMHSVNCSEHAYKQWCEIDFLLLGPQGIFVLEVKGGRISVQEGVWKYVDRYDREHMSAEGPFVQARTAMHALRGLLSDRYGIAYATFDQAVFGFGVVMPDVEWQVDTVEMPRILVADTRESDGCTKFRHYLRRLFAYWSEKKSSPSRISSEDLASIRRKIRPDVDVYPAFSTRVGCALRDMQRLTDEQYERLEIIEANDQVIISGGAGTGKTFLMMQCARREHSLGRRVLVVTESRTLAAQLRRMESNQGIGIYSIDRLAGVGERSDVLFVDEGQDLLTFTDFDLLSAHLSGGLEAGRWRWFMDENNQAHVSGRFEPDALEYLTRHLPAGRPVRVPLLRNVRNTKEIISSVHTWTGAELGRAEFTGFGEPPKVVPCSGDEEYASGVESTVRSLLETGLKAEEIGIVVPSKDAVEWMSLLDVRTKHLLVPLDPTTVKANLVGRICWATAAQFKGLERPVILAVGFQGAAQLNSENVAGFYVATTRANFSLVLFCDSELAGAIARRVRSN